MKVCFLQNTDPNAGVLKVLGIRGHNQNIRMRPILGAHTTKIIITAILGLAQKIDGKMEAKIADAIEGIGQADLWLKWRRLNLHTPPPNWRKGSKCPPSKPNLQYSFPQLDGDTDRGQ